MAIIFDGKSFAKEKEVKLIEEIKRLSEKGIKPKLVSILIGDNPASILYINLKKKAAERIGCALEVVYFPQDTSMIRIIEVINEMNTNQSVHGIMVQLPLPRNFSKEDRDEIINAIAKEKDVDGLREDSSFLTPTVKAVLEVIKEATLYLPFQPEAHANGLSSSGRDRPLDEKVVIIGAKGFEGKKIFKVLKEMGYEVEGVDRKTPYRSYLALPAQSYAVDGGAPSRGDFTGQAKNADILISATGSPGIIGKDEVKEGAVVIDVGSPKGDVKTEEIMKKASFISPVPGGLGPVTISCLLENLVDKFISLREKSLYPGIRRISSKVRPN